MTRLSVNLNKVALLRNSRPLGIPSVTRAAEIALAAGAHGITVHPRPDERHIRPDDVAALSQMIKNRPGAEFNIEGNPFHGVLELVEKVLPTQCTLVPDEPEASTSDRGWDLERDGKRLQPIISELAQAGVRVSLFMEPIPAAMHEARRLGAHRIELYTEPYATFFGTAYELRELERYALAARTAQRDGLEVNAGHDLNRANLPRFLSGVPGVVEVSIGHALISDALELGLAQTVREYLAAIALAEAGAPLAQ